MQNPNQEDHNTADVFVSQPTVNAQNTLRIGQQALINRMLRVIAILGLLAFGAGVFEFVNSGQYSQLVVISVVYLVLLLITFLPGRSYSIQVGILLFLLYLIGVYSLLTSGQTGYGVPFLLTIPVLSILFFDRRVGIIISILVITTVVLFAILYITDVISVPSETLSSVNDINSWVTGVVVFLILVVLMILPLYDIFQRFTAAILQEQQLTGVLQSERAGLEERIAERTQVVARRARYLEASAIVASEASGVIEDTAELLQRVVNLISEQFGFYHTGLFLNDEGGEWTYLRAASSDGGRQMLAKRHRLLIGAQGIVGYVAMHGRPRIASDVGDDAVFFNNPDLPETRSEIALPLQARGVVIGVLDVQSTEIQAFDDEDATVLHSLADQVALAISNARLFTLAQESIQSERRIRGNLTRQGWSNLLQAEQNLVARSTINDEAAADEKWFPEISALLQKSEPVVDSDTQTRIAIPVRVAGQIIGVVAARKSEGKGKWSPEEVGLLDTLTQQLNSAVERARLYRQTQLVASQQRSIAEVGARMRASLQMETMLQTAAYEIREALELGGVEIRLAPPTLVKANNPEIDNGVDQ